MATTDIWYTPKKPIKANLQHMLQIFCLIFGCHLETTKGSLFMMDDTATPADCESLPFLLGSDLEWMSATTPNYGSNWDCGVKKKKDSGTISTWYGDMEKDRFESSSGDYYFLSGIVTLRIVEKGGISRISSAFISSFSFFIVNSISGALSILWGLLYSTLLYYTSWFGDIVVTFA